MNTRAFGRDIHLLIKKMDSGLKPIFDDLHTATESHAVLFFSSFFQVVDVIFLFFFFHPIHIGSVLMKMLDTKGGLLSGSWQFPRGLLFSNRVIWTVKRKKDLLATFDYHNIPPFFLPLFLDHAPYYFLSST